METQRTAPTIGLHGKVVVVTGAAQGIGAEIARVAADVGAHVVVADVQDAGPVVGIIRGHGGAASAMELDVSEPASWDRLVARVSEQFGTIDGLVNNAGINQRSDVESTDPANWAKTLRVDLDGSFYGVRAAAAAMSPDRGGSIVNMSSALGLVGSPAAAYSTAKWALRGLTRSACGTLASKSIRVNSVHPGLIRTAMAQGGTNAYVNANVALTPLRRMGDVREVASVVVFLLSDLSSYVTGAEISVDGGYAAFAGQMEVARIVSELERQT